MAGRRPKAPKGFLTNRDLARIMQDKGYDLKPKTISAYARKGKIPSKPIPGRQRETMFAEEDLKKIISVLPKRVIVPEGFYTAKDVKRILKSMDLPYHSTFIREFVDRMVKGREPFFEGLFQEALTKEHRFILPKPLVNRIIREAKLAKNLPALIKKGKLIPVDKFAEELGVSATTLRKDKKLNKIMILSHVYVRQGEADSYYKAKYRKDRPKKAEPKIKVEKKPVKEKAVEKKPPVDWRTIQEANWRLRNIVPRVRNKRIRERMRKLINDNRHLPYEQFREIVLTKIDNMLAQMDSKSKKKKDFDSD